MFLSSKEQIHLNLDEVMNAREQRQLGLSSLTAEEKVALERWLGDWSQEMLDQGAKLKSKSKVKDWISKNPKRFPLVSSEERKHTFYIDQVIDEGRFIRLSNGSIWRVISPHHRRTRDWLKTQTVKLHKRSSGPHPYRLENIDTKQTVKIDQEVEARSDEQEEEEDSEITLPQELKVMSIFDEGRYVELDDGSVWSVPVRYHSSTRLWRSGARVRLDRSKSRVYPFSLHYFNSKKTINVAPTSP